MPTKSVEIQNRLNELDGLIQGEASDVQKTIWENERNGLRDQLQVALTNEQAHEGRIQEATAESENILDDIEIAGVPIAESGLSELAYKILKAKVQAKFVAKVELLLQEMSEIQFNHRNELTEYLQRETAAEITIGTLQKSNKELEVANYQLGLDNDAMGIKVTKGAELLAEATETIEKQNKTIEDYKKAELLGTPQKVLPDTSEQVALNEAAFKASQIPVVSMVVDDTDFARKTWIIETVVPAEKRSIHYFEKGLYRVVSAEEAEQLRADENNKKAAEEAIQAAIPTISTPDIPPVTTSTGQEAPAEENSFQSDAAEAANSKRNSSLAGNIPMDESLGSNEGEIITLESLHAKVMKLENAVYGVKTVFELIDEVA